MRGMGIVAILAVVSVILFGCDDSEPDTSDEHTVEPYRVAGIDIHTGGDDESWTPDGDDVEGWFRSALNESDRGIATGPSGMDMRATLYHRTRLLPQAGGARVVVDIDARLSRSLVTTNAPMISLRAESKISDNLSGQRPSNDLLRRTARDLGAKAIKEAVDNLRLRARLEQYGPSRIADWIGDTDLSDAQRKVVIDWAVDRGVDVDPALGRALVKAVDGDDDKVVVAASRALVELDVDGAEQALLQRAQRYSRDKHYEHYLELLPLLGELDAPFISIYLETVAEAHDAPRVRDEARSVVADRPPAVPEP